MNKANATRMKCFFVSSRESAISEITSSVMSVSFSTNPIFDGADGRWNIGISPVSFSMTSPVKPYIPSKCSNRISPPSKGNAKDFFLKPGNSLPSVMEIPPDEKGCS